MQLIPDWKKVAMRSYSMWSIYIELICLVLPEILFVFFGLDSDPRIWWLSALALLVFGAVGRLIVQPPIRSPRRMLFLVILLLLLLSSWARPVMAEAPPDAFLQVAAPHVAKWEGKENRAYLDRIASPPVWTICYGETRGVAAGDYRTDAECAAMLRVGLLEYRAALHRYFSPVTKLARLPATRDAAYVSLAWNVGIAGAGRSTATRRLNAGDIAGGCTALTWWNKAGQRVVRGLVNRRAGDYALCMVGL